MAWWAVEVGDQCVLCTFVTYFCHLYVGPLWKRDAVSQSEYTETESKDLFGVYLWCPVMMSKPIFVCRQMGRASAPPTTLGTASVGTEKRLRVREQRVFRAAAGSWRDESGELIAEAAVVPSIEGITEVVKQMVLFFFSFRGEALPSGSHGWEKKKVGNSPASPI